MTFAEELDGGVDDQIAEAGEALSLSRQGNAVGNVVGIFLQAGNSAGTSGEVTSSSTEAQCVIRRSEYTPTGEPTEPRIGDRITFSDSGETWEVRRTSGDAHWTWYGGRRYAYLIQIVKIAGA